MLAETRPSHPTMMTAVRHVAGPLGMSPETLRLWRRRYEVDAGVKPEPTTDAAAEIRGLQKETLHRARSRRHWVCDVTYVATWSGFAYVAVVTDVYSRRIVGWNVTATLRSEILQM